MSAFFSIPRLSHHVGKKLLLSLGLTAATLTSLAPLSSAQALSLSISGQDVQAMRQAIATQPQGLFGQSFSEQKTTLDQQIAQGIDVPQPIDAGGGASHEQHKRNYQLMYQAGLLYQLTQDKSYLRYVEQTLQQYAAMYTDLPLHPKRKQGKDNPGKLFWQSLNEAVWLVYTIQAYDLVKKDLSAAGQQQIEQGVLLPMAEFLSQGSAKTFNKIHNHGTWLTAGVGMTGIVLNQPQLTKQALYGLDLSGQGGFLAQMDQLFSPDGYYAEGPYYQRYALLPFIMFAQALNVAQPEQKIFAYRDQILLKAIHATIQSSYQGKFFPLNDAIKSKGIDTIELVYGVNLAYQLTQDPALLDIAEQQGQILLTGEGLAVAQALAAKKATPYPFYSILMRDGQNGDQGALVVMRTPLAETQVSAPASTETAKRSKASSALVFKPSSQGMGHGHFDKLNWQFYHAGQEIVSDYGAARFLNIEAKHGGRYLPENKSYAKQTIAHNTLVVDEQSHFQGKLKQAEKHAPTVDFYQVTEHGTIAQGSIDTAYDDVSMRRTMLLLDLAEQSASSQPLVIDIFDVQAKDTHQYDLPLHYQGQLMSMNFPLQAQSQQLKPLGEDDGYQHLWLKGQAQATSEQQLSQITWLNDNGHFYTFSSPSQPQEQFLFTQIGANDPEFNLRQEQGFIRRVQGQQAHRFVSVLESHGEYNPSQEYTLGAQSQLTSLNLLDWQSTDHQPLWLLPLRLAEQDYLIAINPQPSVTQALEFQYQQQSYRLTERFAVFQQQL